MPAAYFTGDNHGQSKEARCDAQEKLETWPGQRQACAQEGHKAHDAEKAKVQGARLQGKLKDALEELERDMIREGLRRTGWNKSKLAKELGISRAGLIMKVEKYGLDKRKMLK